MKSIALIPTLLLFLVSATPSTHAQTISSQSWSEPFPGIVILAGRTTAPTTRFWAAFVSLCTDHVHMLATSTPTARQTPATWGSANGVQLAVNGDYFDGESPPHVHGDVVSNGVRWPLAQMGFNEAWRWYSMPKPQYGFIAFGPGWVEFMHTKLVKEDIGGVTEGWMPNVVVQTHPPGTQQLISGWPQLVYEGTRYTCADPTAASCFPFRGPDHKARNPRTAMGLTKERQTMILVVVDGRSGVSAGMYGTEIALLMELLGAHNAYSLDGGGSTAMWLQGVGYLNSPSDGGARSVANHWGVHAGSASGKPKAPGSCMIPTGCYPAPLLQ